LAAFNEWTRVNGWTLAPENQKNPAADLLKALGRQDALFEELTRGLEREKANWTPEWTTRELPKLLMALAPHHLSAVLSLNSVLALRAAAAAQANVDATFANQNLIYAELQKGTDPKRIIELLSADPAYQSRQFGILDLQGRSAGHSGLANGYVSQDIQGQVPGTEIFYSIQGNILRPGQVMPNAVQAFIVTAGTNTDPLPRLEMAAITCEPMLCVVFRMVIM
jgi:hypothetical protein